VPAGATELPNVQPTGSGLSAKAAAAWAALPPEQKNAAGAAGIWQSLVPGMTPEQAAAMHQQTSAYYGANKTAMPDDLINTAISGVGATPPQNADMNSRIRDIAGVQPTPAGWFSPTEQVDPNAPQQMIRQPGLPPTPEELAAREAARKAQGLASLPAANQVPRSFLGAGPVTQKMTLGAVDTLGGSGEQYMSDFMKSLPRYRGATSGKVA
jgi:hypothetical protein